VTLADLLDGLARDPTGLVRVPLATYRLQLGPDLTFDDAAEVVAYLAALGVSDCYTSPFFENASGSAHGYDVSDHNRFRGALGGEAAFGRFAAALRAHGMGLLIDIVPNHMGIAGNRNAWWSDVLEHGAASSYAPFFDIDWAPVKPELANKVLLPILGDHYGAVLDSGQLRLELEDGVFTVRYHDTVLPVAPRTYVQLLRHRLPELERTLGSAHPDLLALKSVHDQFLTLPHRTETDPARLAARHREKQIAIDRFRALLAASADVRDFVEDNVRRFNGTPGDPASFDLLDGLLRDQVYRLAFWRVAGEEINYRRFFDVNELAAIRMEDPRVFAETHRLVLRLVREGVVTGLRVDHPDGLYGPAEYFQRLQRACFLEVARRLVGADREPAAAEWRDRWALEGWDALQARAPGRQAFYIVAEKILAPGEPLPAAWAVAGTTGYEFLNLLNGIFVDRSQARAVDETYRRLIRAAPVFPEIVYESKRLMMQTSMASEVAMLAHRLNIISEKHRSTRDFTLGSIRRALREIIACFPVYRTYVGDVPDRERRIEAGDWAALGPTERDQEYIARAVAQAKRRAVATDVTVYDWIQDCLTLRLPAWATEADRRERLDWLLRFQQLTGPVTAKGYEDTALYRYARLISLNEVGGDPARFGTSLAEFHGAMAARQREHPYGLSATSTHDTKRSEDVRARINVLSEIPHVWRQHVLRWQRLNRRHRTTVDGRPVPGPNEEYFLYQTLVGAWPISGDRLRAYLLKAVREAKVHTSWVNANPRYEEALLAFIDAVLDPGRSEPFLADFTAFHARVAWYGALNSLSQTLVKITAPGVPDFYQGTELWDFSLVDPDNRRPVDFALRRRLLEGLTAELAHGGDRRALAEALLKSWEDGRVKLYVIHQALGCRRARRALFERGEYLPLEASGPLAEHVCAYARRAGPAAAVTVVPRLLARRGVEDPPLGPTYWADTAVPAPTAAPLVNVFTGERVEPEHGRLPLGRVLARFPVALLAPEA
jgi:(1->4)-alpha-D-glucan 1-alpha-D-glucosylmutase